MVILPAVDLLDGNAVRLAQGKREQVSVYSRDPLEAAKRWVDAGAKWLHVVDLNGAFEGNYINLHLAKRIIEECGAKVELSGGIRTEEALSRAIAAGAARVVLGTKACEDPQFVQNAVLRYGSKIAVAIDAKAGQVVSRGWVSQSAMSAADLTRDVIKLGVETLVCTDVSRDGTLGGPNIALLNDVLNAGAKQLIASGGIASLADVMSVKGLEPRRLTGAIIGKALYEGTIKLDEAIKLAEQ